jgi:multisubunit Na+/H+ antiporter MnhG subunit
VSRDGDTQLMPLVPPATVAGRKRGRRSTGAPAGARQVSVAHHPRIAARVHAAKGWGALGAFALVALASSGAGAQTFDVLLRALVAGIVGWVVAWAAAVGIGRALVTAEVEAHRRALDDPGDPADG